MADMTAELDDALKRIESTRHDTEQPIAQIRAGLAQLEEPLKRVAASWSGSDIGYHARLYYEGFDPPPLHRSFDVEWGGLHGLEGWMDADVDAVAVFVESAAGSSAADLDGQADELVARCRELATDVIVALSPLSARDDLPRERELLAQLEDFQWGSRAGVRVGAGYRIT